MARMENYSVRPGTETASRRAALERRTIHVPDILAASDFEGYQTEPHRREGMRSALTVPLLKDDTLLGVLTTHRKEVRPFTESQIKLLETFANQAVIAIENVRLFQELKESLEQQTATSEILGVIASSPTDIQPVLDTIASRAAKICGANDGLSAWSKEILFG
jgi:GAF domain-containing protein